MNLVENQLLKLARRAKGILVDVNVADLSAVYSAAGLDASKGMDTRDAGMVFYDRIAQAFEWTDANTAVDLDALEDHIVLRWLADDAPFLDLAVLLNALKEATRIARQSWLAPPLSEEARWIEALGCARDYGRVYQRLATHTPYVNPRSRIVANAITRLRAEGFVVEIRNGKAHITPDHMQKIGRLIDDGVRDLGGIEFSNFLFDRMRHWYDDEQKRHHAVRRVSTTGRDDGVPVTPVGYLLQLAAKHATLSPNTSKASNEYAVKVLTVATALADAMDIRSVSAFDGLFKDGRTLIPYLREIVLFDGTYSLVQARPKSVRDSSPIGPRAFHVA